MTDMHRRTFFLKVVAAGSLLAGATSASQAQAKIEESDPQASALGYKHDTKKVDKAKFPKHDDSQTCSQLPAVPGQAAGRMGGMRHLRRQAGRGTGVVQRLDQEGRLIRHRAAGSCRATSSSPARSHARGQLLARVAIGPFGAQHRAPAGFSGLN